MSTTDTRLEGWNVSVNAQTKLRIVEVSKRRKRVKVQLGSGEPLWIREGDVIDINSNIEVGKGPNGIIQGS